jgi:hypothetical protein
MASGAAFVDTDPITTPRAEFSRRGNVHAALGSMFILGFPVAATVVAISAAGDPAVGLVSVRGPVGGTPFALGFNGGHSARPDVSVAIGPPAG